MQALSTLSKKHDYFYPQPHCPRAIEQKYLYGKKWVSKKIDNLTPTSTSTEIKHDTVLTKEQKARVIASYHFHNDTQEKRKYMQQQQKGKDILAKYSAEERDAIKKALS